jgi:CO/xanthine dehydrogenase FAD-binding subunit
MDTSDKQIFYPTGFQELFTIWSRFPNAVLYAGGTEFMRNQSLRIPILPGNIISLDKIEELRKISRTERYIEIGAMVKLNQIINLGKIVPEALTKCLEYIAGPQLRNQATIGGNICNSSRRLDGSAAMIALDAQFELRTAGVARWISAPRFSSLPGPSALATHEILTRIRVPLEPWNFSCYRKFNTTGSNEPGNCILFVMRNQKNILSSIRVVYSGKTILRDKNSETMLEGKRLPLDRKDADEFVESWKSYLSQIDGKDSFVSTVKTGYADKDFSDSGFFPAQIINFLETTILSISD